MASSDVNTHLSSEFKKILVERINGISSKFKLNYPINPKLRYEYPPINEIIIENIINALVSVPKFYIQTLHLMNKMNLPCPLVSYVRMPRHPSALNAKNPLVMFNNPESSNKEIIDEQINQTPVDMSTSETESEIESDTDSSKINKETRTKSIESKTKKLKIKSFIKPVSVNKTVDRPDRQEVFEVSDDVLNKKSLTKKITIQPASIPSLETERMIVDSEFEGFSKMLPINRKIDDLELKENEGVSDQPTEKSDFISKNELEKNRLKISELKDLPVFKNYDKGEPNTRIYIKNLGKTVTDSDLKYIYGRYIDWNDEIQKNSFDIRLMKEGRMKGQAFITFPNENLANKALNETNGYLFDNKPIVVQFARSAKPK